MPRTYRKRNLEDRLLGLKLKKERMTAQVERKCKAIERIGDEEQRLTNKLQKLAGTA